MSDISRRLFLARLLQAGVTLSTTALSKAAFAQTSFNGKLLMTIQCQGAWDVSSFCDPKTNVAGEKEINHWARTKSIGTAGNLRYAPFGINQKFFDKHYSKMLVINGVDMQTNSHSTGEISTWSGRTALGYPALTSVYAASVAPELALASINLGGWGNSEGLLNPTRIKNPNQLNSVIYPNTDNSNTNKTMVSANDMARIQALQMQSVENILTEQAALPQDLLNRQNYLTAIKNSEGLKAFGALIPKSTNLQAARTLATRSTTTSTIHQQAQIALLAFKSGLCVAADLVEGGFDSHFESDTDQDILLANVMDAVDQLWDYAEQLELANRLVVIIGSDFSRTPYYNAGNGKDHWPISSYVVMEKNVRYTNRMVGLTDGGHNALKINPQTLARDDSKGALIYSNHVHKALRRYLGLENMAAAKLFPFNGVEDFPFFS